MASDRLLLISGDGHAALPLPEYRQYLETRYHEAFDETLAMEDPGVELPFETILGQNVSSRYKRTFFESGAIEGRADDARRVEELNKDGVTAEVVFPDGAPFAAGSLGGVRAHYPAELELAGARAYNRFIADFIEPYKERFAGQAIVVLNEPEEAVKDVYWAAEHGLKGLVMPGLEEDKPLFWDPIYEPLWAAAAETGLPLAFHGGIGQPSYAYGDELAHIPFDIRLRLVAFEFTFWSHRPFWFMIWSGILERHPKLRLTFTETHSDWVIPTLAQMDHSWAHSMYGEGIYQYVPKKPSEYYRRQIWIGSSLLSRGEVQHRKEIGTDKMMFGVDFPHPEGCWGMTREYLQATVGKTDMTETEVRDFLGLNAARFYGFDTAALQPTVDTYGLSLKEVTTPIPAEREAIFWEGLDVFRPAAYT